MRIFLRVLPIVLYCAAAPAQTPARPEFEVASIKPSAESAGTGASPTSPARSRKLQKATRKGPSPEDPERYTANRVTLLSLLMTAYQLAPYQISGPAWLDSSRFDVNAKIPEGATKAQFGPMLQNLLADRFKLVTHRETKQMTVYDLVVAKGGPRIRDHVELPPGPPPAPAKLEMDAYGLPASPMFGAGKTSTVMTPDRARLWAYAETMPQLAEMLSGQLAKPVTDSTELKAKYDFVLSWAPDSAPRPSGDAASDPAALPTLLAAVQEQLGLKLEPKKGPVAILVIDHIDKLPTEN